MKFNWIENEDTFFGSLFIHIFTKEQERIGKQEVKEIMGEDFKVDNIKISIKFNDLEVDPILFQEYIERCIEHNAKLNAQNFIKDKYEDVMNSIRDKFNELENAVDDITDKIGRDIENAVDKFPNYKERIR